MNSNETIDRNMYGAVELNGLVDGLSYHRERGFCPTVGWETPGLKITRLRLVSDPGFPFWDVSYCHGTLDGKNVNVGLPFFQLPKRGMRKAIVDFAKKEGLFAKGMGILDNISTLC
jgi:hypothetical protein